MQLLTLWNTLWINGLSLSYPPVPTGPRGAIPNFVHRHRKHWPPLRVFSRTGGFSTYQHSDTHNLSTTVDCVAAESPQSPQTALILGFSPVDLQVCDLLTVCIRLLKDRVQAFPGGPLRPNPPKLSTAMSIIGGFVHLSTTVSPAVIHRCGENPPLYCPRLVSWRLHSITGLNYMLVSYQQCG